MTKNRVVLLEAINAILKADKYFDTVEWFKDKDFIINCKKYINE